MVPAFALGTSRIFNVYLAAIMYENCPIKSKICAQAFISENKLHCGKEIGENRILHMDKCPYDKKVKRATNN